MPLLVDVIVFHDSSSRVSTCDRSQLLCPYSILNQYCTILLITINPMTVQIQIELPESVFSALRSNPDRFVQEMRLAAAVKWYEIEMISQAKAAEIAGVSRQEFIVRVCLQSLKLGVGAKHSSLNLSVKLKIFRPNASPVRGLQTDPRVSPEVLAAALQLVGE